MKTMAKDVNNSLSMVRDYAPNLICLRAALLPFSDVIIEESAGPQPQSLNYSPEEEPWFSVTVKDPQAVRGEVVFTFTADTVTFESIVYVKRRPVLVDEPHEITLQGVFDFLRQLPRSIWSY